MIFLLPLISLLAKIFEKPMDAYFESWLKKVPAQPAGYAVRQIGRDEYQYFEGERQLRFVAEMLTGKINRAFYASEIRHLKWEPPYESETITDEHYDRIIANIRSYFDRNRVTYELL